MARYLSFRDGGKTDEEGISRYVSKIFDGEVIDGLLVTQQGPLALGVTVASGDVMIPSGNDYPYIAWNDASFNITLATADGTNPRYDLIVAYIDLGVVQSTTPNNPDALVLDNVTGTPAGSPVEPNQAAIEAVIGVGNPYVILARVTVGAGVTTISNSVIVDRRDLLSVGIETAESASGGWVDLSGTFTVASGYNTGNKSFDISTSSDLTGVLPLGAKIKFARGTTPPTQCTDLESGSTQGWSDTSLTGLNQTDDISAEAWVKVESYKTASIITQRTGQNGWDFLMGSDGTFRIHGVLSAGNHKLYQTHSKIPLNKWTHVAGSMDMSANSGLLYVNGIQQPVTTSNSGTANSFTSVGSLYIGTDSTNSSTFDGKIADARIWSAVRTVTQIRDNMCQQLVGNETNLVGYWKFNGNGNDSTSNANNLSAVGSATATNVDNPMNSTEYGIVTRVTTTAITVFTGTDGTIPNMTLSSPMYSLWRAPLGFNADRNRWIIEMVYPTSPSTNFGAINQWTASVLNISVPLGAWEVGHEGAFGLTSTVNGSRNGNYLLSDISPTNVNFNYPLCIMLYNGSGVSTSDWYVTTGRKTDVVQTTQTVWTEYATISSASGTESFVILGTRAPTRFWAQCPYV